MNPGSGIPGNEKVRKDRKEWLLLLLSLLLAFIVWLIHSLSLQYSVFLEYRVTLSTSIEGRSRTATSEDILIIRGRSEGYYILRQRIGRLKNLTVTVLPANVTYKDGDIFTVDCETIKSNIVEALGGNVDLEFIVSESLDFNLPEVTSKRVPVVPKASIVFDGQYMPVGDIELRPDSVDIYGDARLLGTIDSVFTETIARSGVDGPIQGLCGIVPIRRVEYSEDNIYYSMNVVRYIEESMNVPVTATGVPENKELIILPSSVTLKYRRIFSGMQYAPENFVLSVDYNDFIRTMDSELVPKLVSMPEGVLSWEMSPRYVDCILLENSGRER
ncbi:MAG TPA: hypothetical protein IAC05_06320 [Candidatus Coprenecus stercorigallinarum]|nr:hypothetical protein [Candidatus Coprenecus stercorigallinarum]